MPTRSSGRRPAGAHPHLPPNRVNHGAHRIAQALRERVPPAMQRPPQLLAWPSSRHFMSAGPCYGLSESSRGTAVLLGEAVVAPISLASRRRRRTAPQQTTFDEVLTSAKAGF